MKSKLISILFALFISSLSIAQQGNIQQGNEKTIVFWNVDKLYDINNDPLTKDDEFLPTALKQWNEERYRKKIADLAEAISAIEPGDLPVILGLAEIENQKVLSDLASSQKLKLPPNIASLVRLRLSFCSSFFPICSLSWAAVWSCIPWDLRW